MNILISAQQQFAIDHDIETTGGFFSYPSAGYDITGFYSTTGPQIEYEPEAE